MTKTNRSRWPLKAMIFGGCAFLAGCEQLENNHAPDDPLTGDVIAAPEPSAQSKSLRRYYARLQQDLLVQGLLRRDGGGPDVPFTARDLERNFVSIALFDEYVTTGGALVATPVQSKLRRWDRPVRLNLRFGASVPRDQRDRDVNAVASYVPRLAGLTGQSLSLTQGDGNFTVLVLNEDERRAFGSELRKLVPGIDTPTAQAFIDMPRATLCLVFAFSQADGAAGYTKAVAIIRAEHPELLRLSCIHEELAQGMGLANDTPAARPSIFNDDEEFALLTDHDALLLKMLYDPRLQTGMTEADARPIIRVIAKELMDDTYVEQEERG